MKKPLNLRTTHTEVDVQTGEFKRIVTDEALGYADVEPPYIKIYLGTQLVLNGLDPQLAKYIVVFSRYITFANDQNYEHMIQINSLVREQVAEALNVSIKRVDQIIRLLVDSRVFVPIYRESEKDGVVTRTKRRGVYFVNPIFCAKGSWKDIKKLRQSIDFVSGTTEYVISDKTGERNISVKLPDEHYEQLRLELPGSNI